MKLSDIHRDVIVKGQLSLLIHWYTEMAGIKLERYACKSEDSKLTTASNMQALRSKQSSTWTCFRYVSLWVITKSVENGSAAALLPPFQGLLPVSIERPYDTAWFVTASVEWPLIQLPLKRRSDVGCLVIGLIVMSLLNETSHASQRCRWNANLGWPLKAFLVTESMGLIALDGVNGAGVPRLLVSPPAGA